MNSPAQDASEQSVAVTDTRLTHEVHRVATALLAEAAVEPSVPPAALLTLRDFLVANLRHHDQAEDDDLWPRIIAVAPDTADALHALSAEHERLRAALDALSDVAMAADGAASEADRTALRQAAVAVRDLVHDHLAHEEPILLPALREHISPAAWDEFAQKVISTAPPVGGHLMIGFLAEVGTPAEVEAVLAGVPEPMRPLLPALRAQAAEDIRVLRGAGS
ncbi:hemerythrin domain-containing protein [Catenulispora sp. NL8]|uniref:Hemerythrin domain-containing protein n=1 Tax=Catenulispora pinistramenti TaxID=2705254 RepID=A0ABS5KVX5_9ACTN|nr:hemerythrin domain-containing protein [Catenulispora pinistramenti]MBS2550187.1 hemerythrin domain-containing protein [Catenulispora pinistramenti]